MHTEALSNETQGASQPAAVDTLASLLDSRYSCRGFLPKPVPREIIARILELSQRTASWCNSQPWEVAITTGEGTERFRQALLARVASGPGASDIPWPREYLDQYRDRRRECGMQLYQAVGVTRDDKDSAKRQSLENFRLFGAPHVALISTPEALGTYGAVDCGAFVGNFMLAARSLGVASIAQAALASHSSFIHEFFGIPDNRQVVCGISFGYEDPAHPANQFRTTRAPIADTVTWVER